MPLLPPLWTFMVCSRLNFTFTLTARKRNLIFVHSYSGQTSSTFPWLLIFLIEVTTNAELVTIYIYIYIQSVPGGMCQTSGECSLS